MKLTSIINKNKNGKYWIPELSILFTLEDDFIYFGYKGHSLLATDDFKAIDRTDEDWPFETEAETLEEATKYLLKIKLENRLEEKTEKRKVHKI